MILPWWWWMEFVVILTTGNGEFICVRAGFMCTVNPCPRKHVGNHSDLRFMGVSLDEFEDEQGRAHLVEMTKDAMESGVRFSVSPCCFPDALRIGLVLCEGDNKWFHFFDIWIKWKCSEYGLVWPLAVLEISRYPTRLTDVSFVLRLSVEFDACWSHDL